MKASFKPVLLVLLCVLPAGIAASVEFQDDFDGRLAQGWTWIRENPAAWRIHDRALEVRIEPGNMWGGANDAKNVLVRSVPDPATQPVEVSVTVENRPTVQYEQVDLAWYYGDSFMVKLGQELVDGKLSVVMGREESDRTRTIAIVPLESFVVRLRFQVDGNQIRGAFQTPESELWREVGTCDLPAPKNAAPKVSLQFYQGPAQAGHWARITEFRIRPLERKEPKQEKR